MSEAVEAPRPDGESAPALVQAPTSVAVCGPGEATEAELAAAELVGRLLAERGCVVVCGGLGGAMAAVCRGAKGVGGTTIGILPGYEGRAANRWVDHAICTGLGQARNALVVATGQAVIAVGGGAGTLSEVALGLRLGRRVVLVGGWGAVLTGEEATALLGEQAGSLAVVETAEEAVAVAVAVPERG